MSRVVWKRARCGVGIEVRLGHLMLCAWDRADAKFGGAGFAWRVDAVARDAHPDETVMAIAEGAGDAGSLDRAQDAAVVAGVRLLFDALRVEDPFPIALHLVEAELPGVA